MNKKFFILCIAALVLCMAFPSPASAAQARRTLSAGAYAFVNNDARTVSYFTVGGGVRFDYVTRDAYGDVTDYGTATGRAAVKGGGTTAIRLNGTAAVTYDNAAVTLRESPGDVLTRYALAEGATVSVFNDSEKALSISVDNAKRTEYAQYDYAAYDRDGLAGFFTEACRYTSMPLPLSGKAVFTAGSGGLTLMFPAEWTASRLRLQNENHPALLDMTLRYGQSYTFANEGDVDYIFNLPKNKLLTYEYIKKDEWGYTTDYGLVERADALAVAARQTVSVTPRKNAAADTAEGVGFLYPYDQSKSLTVTEQGVNKLTLFTVAAGETFSFTNNGEIPFTFRADKTRAASVLDYTYSGGIKDETRSVSGEIFTEMTVAAGYTWTFTVKKGLPLPLWLPAEWLNKGLSTGGDTRPALTEYILLPGQTLLIENADLSAAFDIRLAADQPIHEFNYDYMTEDDGNIVQQFDCDDEKLVLPPRGVMAVTNRGRSAMAVRCPSAAALTARETEQAALRRYALRPGQSMRFRNVHEERAFVLKPQNEENTSSTVITVLDFLLRNDENEIEDYGCIETGSSFTLEAGSAVMLTNDDITAVEFVLPLTWFDAGFAVENAEGKALYKRALRENNAFDIVNLDKRYDREFKIINERKLPVGFDYVLRDGKEVMDFGVGAAGYVRLPAGGSYSLMPRKGTALVLCWPSEWNEKTLKASASQNTPLYRMTLKPDERYTFNNRSRISYSIQNSSQSGTGRYYMREENTAVRPLRDEQPVTGAIEVSAETAVSILAAKGADLEIWMPREWVKNLIR